VALIYNTATLTPSKIELLMAWVASQPWAAGSDVSTLEPVGAYRFDDPTGEVGIETHLVRTRDGALLQIPLTYRGAPLPGAESALVGTMEHSALGTRWVYDGCADPVYAAALATAILTGGEEAELEFAGSTERHRGRTRVIGSGTATTPIGPVTGVTSTPEGTSTRIRAAATELVVHRVLPNVPIVDHGETLSGTWPGHDDPVVLAIVG
jgi:Maltokinase N-terminal cap domain